MNEFNLVKEGRPLCKIKDGKLDGTVISIAPIGEVKKNTFPIIRLPEDSKFQIVPDTNKERDILYITGASGSGKTFFTAGYIKEYKKTYKKNEVYVFSALKEDETLDKLGIKRIKVDKNLIEDPLTIYDFKNSLVIFDDIDVISDKKLREAVYKILNAILECGRHEKISCVNTNHLPTNKGDTRRILNESHAVIYFPHSGSVRSINYLLMDYVGLTKEDIQVIKGMKSRWCCIFKNYPQIAMTERNLWFVGEDE
jgi:Cdc6-like AAA superfamily ATPase